MSIRNKIDSLFTPSFSRKGKLFTSSRVFCMAPWIQLHAQTDGKIYPCCMAAIGDNNEIGDLRKDPDLTQAWNSDKMKQLRLNMLSGQKSSLCNNCYKYEELDKFSERMQYNQDFRHYYKRVKDTMKDGSVNTNEVPIIDVRFSNKCNYKCRICNSNYSSLWYEEELKLGKNMSGKEKEVTAAAEEEKFWASFLSMMPYVRRLHFAGGEPLFMDEHYKVLEHLVSIGKTDVNLTYNTNLSTLRYKKYNVIDYWKKFDRVDIWASLDGMGDKGDYQRKGQKWKVIEENIRTIQSECNNIAFGVNVTVSIFNVMHVPDFFRHMLESGFIKVDKMNLYPLFYPHHFCVTNLTPALKKTAIKKLEDFEIEYLNALPGSAKIKDHIKAIINLMRSEQKYQLSEFQKDINSVDDLREENFVSTFPELSELMGPTGSSK